MLGKGQGVKIAVAGEISSINRAHVEVSSTRKNSAQGGSLPSQRGSKTNAAATCRGRPHHRSPALLGYTKGNRFKKDRVGGGGSGAPKKIG